MLGPNLLLSAQDLIDSLKAAGARQISFNPFTEAVLTKRLLAIAEAEDVPLSKPQAESLAVRSAGDLAAALNTLQLSARGQLQSSRIAAKPSKKVDASCNQPWALYCSGQF